MGAFLGMYLMMPQEKWGKALFCVVRAEEEGESGDEGNNGTKSEESRITKTHKEGAEKQKGDINKTFKNIRHREDCGSVVGLADIVDEL